MGTSTEEATPDLLALDQQLCFALAVASRSVIGAYRPILEPLGLTHPQYLVMLALWETEPRSLTELADVLRLEPATLSPLVKRLEAAEAGRVLRAEATRVPPQVVAALGVDMEELTELHARLTAIIGRIAPLSSV
jgi:hypothetical protein